MIIERAPTLLTKAVMRLRERLLKTVSMVLPAYVTVFEQIAGVSSTMLLHAAAHWKVADRLHLQPMKSEELASVLGTNTDATHRLMRALVSIGFFEMDKNGVFRNNRLSNLLRRDHPDSLGAFAEYMGSKYNADAWIDLKETVRTGQSAFERVHGVSVWEWYAKNPADGRLFAQAMGNVTEIDAPAIALSYPFDKFKTVCDVAGGKGTLLAALLKKHKQLTGVLVDEGRVIEEDAIPFLQKQGVIGRTRLAPGDIFKALPKTSAGCDVYILKDVLHDWEDNRCLKILGNIRAVMKEGAKILIPEIIVEKFSTESPGPLVDLHMMVVCSNGRQRSGGEMKMLLEESGFSSVRVIVTPYPLSIVEATSV